MGLADTALTTSQLAQIPVTNLKGVGPKMAERLERLGLRSVQDVLLHLPSRYQDRTQVTPIAALRMQEYATVVAEMKQKLQETREKYKDSETLDKHYIELYKK